METTKKYELSLDDKLDPVLYTLYSKFSSAEKLVKVLVDKHQN